MFPGQKKGQHITAGGVNSLLKDFAKKYDIREEVMHPHSFRHFFAIQSLNNGVDMSLLKDLLGHGSIDTTQIYTQLSSTEQKKRFNAAVKWYGCREYGTIRTTVSSILQGKVREI